MDPTKSVLLERLKKLAISRNMYINESKQQCEETHLIANVSTDNISNAVKPLLCGHLKRQNKGFNGKW